MASTSALGAGRDAAAVRLLQALAHEDPPRPANTRSAEHKQAAVAALTGCSDTSKKTGPTRDAAIHQAKKKFMATLTREGHPPILQSLVEERVSLALKKQDITAREKQINKEAKKHKLKVSVLNKVVKQIIDPKYRAQVEADTRLVQEYTAELGAATGSASANCHDGVVAASEGWDEGEEDV